jgi:transcriptional regulator with XRE-family HTH domain
MSLVDALEAKRRELGLTPSEFAVALGISNSYWSRLKNGQRSVTNGIIGRLATRPELADVLKSKEVGRRLYDYGAQ